MFDLDSLTETALDILRFDGEIGDTLTELRRHWDQSVPALFDARLDHIVLQYRPFEHEVGVQALGQELSTLGWGLYDLDKEDEYLFVLISDAQKVDFEKQCRKAKYGFKRMKQRGRKWGQPAKTQNLQPVMPCQDVYFPDDAYYTIQEIAGNFASGIWIAKEDDQQGKFVADLRNSPLQPIRVQWKDFRELTYSQELDFYAAIYSSPYSDHVIGGKDPVRINEWPALTPRSMKKLGRLYWFCDRLCCGDEESLLFLTMNERGCENTQRFILSASDEECQLAADGQGRIFAQRHRRDSRLTCYENQDLNAYPFLRMKDYDALGNSIPIPGTSRLLMIKETWGEGDTKGNLFDLDMDSGHCQIVPLPGMGENLKIRHFTGDWVLIYNSGEDFRTDFAQLWNSKTNEILRIRSGMFGLQKPDHIAALPDGQVVITTRHSQIGSVLHRPEDFWTFLRTANKPKKLGKWLRYSASYPNIHHTLPKSKGKSCQYKLSKLEEPVLKFKNLNFKLAVMNVLMYDKGLLEPKFDIWEFADEYSRRRIDPETEGYDQMIPEAANWVRRYPIPARLASEITRIDMDGGDEINCQLAPNWDGEDELFNIQAITPEELSQFPRLQRASIFTTQDRSVVPVFRQCGITVVSAYDVPFDIEDADADPQANAFNEKGQH